MRQNRYSKTAAFYAAVFFMNIGCGNAFVATPPQQNVLLSEGQELYDIIENKETTPNIAHVAMMLAKERHSAQAIEMAQNKLSQLADDFRLRLPKGASNKDAIMLLIKIIETHRRVACQKSEEYHRASDIIEVLNGSEGNCFSLGLIYLVLGERVGLPICGVHAPEHFFVRFEGGGTQINIEPTTGKITTDRHYISTRNIHTDALQSGAYMRSLSRREVAASLLASRIPSLLKMGRHEDALREAALARAINPSSPQIHVNYGLALEESGRHREAEDAYHKALLLDPRNIAALHNIALQLVKPSTEAKYNKMRLALARRMIERALKLAPGRESLQKTYYYIMQLSIK